MKYNILYDGHTGDSFHSEDYINHLFEYDFDDLNEAIQCLQRIKEHYKWYESINNSYSWRPKPLPEPEWRQNCKYNAQFNFICKGKEVIYYADWCGYFDQLHGARIVSELDYTFEFWM